MRLCYDVLNHEITSFMHPCFQILALVTCITETEGMWSFKLNLQLGRLTWGPG